MRKSSDTKGNKIFVIKIEALVSLAVFTTALCEENFCGNGNRIDFEKLKKEKAMQILKQRLRCHGMGGEYQGETDMCEIGEEYNESYAKAKKWVIKNYPYLNAKK